MTKIRHLRSEGELLLRHIDYAYIPATTSNNTAQRIVEALRTTCVHYYRYRPVGWKVLAAGGRNRWRVILTIVVFVGVVPLSEVGARRPDDDVGRVRRGGREERGPLEADGQRKGRGGAQARRPPVLVHGTVPGRAGQSGK